MIVNCLYSAAPILHVLRMSQWENTWWWGWHPLVYRHQHVVLRMDLHEAHIPALSSQCFIIRCQIRIAHTHHLVPAIPCHNRRITSLQKLHESSTNIQPVGFSRVCPENSYSACYISEPMSPTYIH